MKCSPINSEEGGRFQRGRVEAPISFAIGRWQVNFAALSLANLGTAQLQTRLVLSFLFGVTRHELRVPISKDRFAPYCASR
jgi:hypothetical protein